MKPVFRPSVGGRAKRPAVVGLRRRLELEPLEDRRLPSAGPVLVSSNGQRPALAIDGAGNFVVAYLTPGSSGETVTAQRFDVGQTARGSPIYLAVPGNPLLNGSPLTLAGNSAGDFLLAYPTSQTTPGGVSLGLVGQRFSPGGGALGAPLRLFDPAQPTASGPSILAVFPAAGLDAGGGSVLSLDGLVTTFPNGQPRTTQETALQSSAASGPISLPTIPNSPAVQPALAMDDAGSFVVVWNSSGNVTAEVYNPQGPALGGPIAVATGASSAAVAMDPASGAFVVAWADSNGVSAQLFQSNGTPQGAAIAVAVNATVPNGGTGSDTQAFSPVVGVDAASDFAVAYKEATTPVNGGITGPTTTAVLASQFDVGLPPVPIQVSSPNDAATPGNLALAMNATGSFVVSWDQSSGTPAVAAGVEARLFTPTDLAITNSDGVAAYVPGQSVTYSITVTNPGLTAVSNAALVDNLPAAVTSSHWTTIVSPGATVAASSGNGSIDTTVSLAPGAGVTFVLGADVSPSATGNLVNTATVTPPSGLTQAGGNSATDLDTPNPLADLAITNTDPTGTYTAGTTITYTVVVSNNGPSAAVGAPVVDDLPAGITGDTWTASASAGASASGPSGSGNLATTVSLLPGASVTFTVAAAVSPETTGMLVNTATVAVPAGVTDPNPFNNSATDNDTPSPIADLAVTNGDGLTDYTPGTTVNYTIVVTDKGPSAVTTAAVTDNLPPAVLSDTWTATPSAGAAVDQASGSGNIAANVDLQPGASVSFQLAAAIDPNATGDLVNTATINPPSGVTDPDFTNNTATVTNPAPPAPPPPPPGLTNFDIDKNLAYSQTSNGVSASPVDAFFDSFLDQVPQSFATAMLTDPGASSPLTYGLDGLATQFSLGQTFATQAEMDAAFPFGSYVGTAAQGANGATATASIQYTQDVYSEDVPAFTPASFNALQGFDPTQPITVNFNSFIANPASTLAEDATFFTIFGPPGVVFSQVLPYPSTTTSVTIPANTLVGNTQYTVELDFSDRIVAGNAPVTTQLFDVRTDIAATTAAPPVADLAITNTDPVGSYTVGGSIEYTIVVTNNGPSAVTGASVVDNLPSAFPNGGFWFAVPSPGASVADSSGTPNINTTVDLQPGASVTFDLLAFVDDPNTTGNIVNTATVEPPAGVTDPFTDNNTASDIDVPAPTQPSVADLAITNTDPAGTYTTFGGINFTIVASNNGPSAVTEAAVVDDLPPSLANPFWFTETSAGASVADSSGFSNINTTVDLQPGASVTFFLLAFADDPSTTGDIVTTATISPPADITDPNLSNNTATDTDQPGLSADLAVQFINQPGVYTAGTDITYTIVVSNAGPSAVVAAPVADTFPAVITSDTWTAVGANGGSAANVSGSGAIATSVDLPSGASVTFTVVAAIDPTATGDLSDTASVALPSGVANLNPSDNEATETDAPNPIVNLLITDTDGTTLYVPGTTSTYTIVVTSAGPSALTGASVVDRLPAAVSGATWTAVASAGASVGDPSGSGGIDTTISLLPDASVTFTMTADIAAAAAGSLGNTVTVTQPPGIIVDPGNNSATDDDVPVPIPLPPPAPPTVSPATVPSPPSPPVSAPQVSSNLSQVAGILSAPPNPPPSFIVEAAPLGGTEFVAESGLVPFVESEPSVPFYILATGEPGPNNPDVPVPLGPGDISGVIFLDRNGNGLRDPGDPGIAGLTVFIDRHGDGLFHKDDPQATTNERGEYVFHGLPLNRVYQVRPVPPQFMVQTYPRKDGAQVVPLSDSHPSQTDVSFGTVPFPPPLPPVRPVETPTAPPPMPPGKASDAPPEESSGPANDAAFQGGVFWRAGAGAIPAALLAVHLLGPTRRRRPGWQRPGG